MKATCPSCGVGGSIELFLADLEWREAVLESARLPSDCAGPAMRYLGMFRPGTRYLTPDRTARLLREVADMILHGADFDRQHIHAPSHVWRAALIDMLDAPNVKRPLKNHHYLLRIVQGKLGQQADAAPAERAELRRNSESVQRNGPMRPIAEFIEPELPALPLDQRAQWMQAALSDLLMDKHFNKDFPPPEVLIEHRARQMFKKAQ